MSQSVEDAAKGGPRVTVIVIPRERYGLIEQQLDSVYAASTDIPFNLVYIDNRSPHRIREWLKGQAAEKGFQHLQFDRFLTPNEARNIGVAASTTEYVVFIDNDVLCADGWLSALVECADETAADVVAPLTCEGLPLHSRVHQATGWYAKNQDPDAFFATPPGERELIDMMVHIGKPLDEVRHEIVRADTQMCEFHCTLIRRSIFDKIGPLDEEMYATKEHVDFCMLVGKAGGRLVLEPRSVVTYVFPNSKAPLEREDLDYFLLRWSPEWQVRSLEHMKLKWGLKHAEEIEIVSDAEYMRERHDQGFIKPAIKKIPIVRSSYRLRALATRVLRLYTDAKIRALSAEYDTQRAAARRSAPKPQSLAG